MSSSSVKYEVSEPSEIDQREPIFPPDILRDAIHISSPIVRNALSEFFGTALLLLIGDSIVMQFILTDEKLNTWIQINIGWGLAITLLVYCCAKTSGGHFNPAVSLAMVTLGKLSLADFFMYCIAQTSGAFIGAVVALGIYYDQFMHFTGGVMKIIGPKSTARCFCSFPEPYISNATCFFDQVVGTGLLLFFVCAITDKRNRIPDAAHPTLFGFALILIGTSFGLNLGYPINPARDLGPRLVAYFIYGEEVFTYHDYYFWIPIFGPLVGAVLAAWMYYTCIGAHIPDPINRYAISCNDSKSEISQRSVRSARRGSRAAPRYYKRYRKYEGRVRKLKSESV